MLLSPAGAEQEVFVRNLPVENATVRGGERWVPLAELERYLEPAEIERLQLDLSTHQIRVDEEVLEQQLLPGDPVRAPLLAIVSALGFEKRVNAELGLVDYVPPGALTPRAQLQKRAGGADYRRAEAAMKATIAETGLTRNTALAERVEAIGQRVAEASDMPTLEWHFLVLATPTLNAYTTGPGFVAITEGLLALGLSDDELAAFLAHEVAHGCNKDQENERHNRAGMASLEGEMARLEQRERRVVAELRAAYSQLETLRRQLQIAQSYGDQTLYLELSQDFQTARQVAERLERELAGVRARLAKAAKDWKVKDDLVNSQLYRQKDEVDADVKGLRYASQAGFEPEALLTGLAKIQAYDTARGNVSALRGLGDHPAAGTRIEVLKKVLADWRRGGY